MFYKGRNLRRFWEVTIYTGDPDAKRPKTKTETVIAFNEVDAVRACGNRKVAKPPEPLFFVTFPTVEDENVYRIDTTGGPTDEVVTPTIVRPA